MIAPPIYTGWAQYYWLKRTGGCLVCKGRRFLTEMSIDGEDIFECSYCPRDPDPKPVRHA